MPFFKKDSRIINFVHIPKTAGTSILRLLKLNNWKEIKIDIIKTNHPHRNQYKAISNDLEPEFEFCVIRDPLERFISGAYQTLRALKEVDVLEGLTFNEDRYELNNDKIVGFAHALFTKTFPEEGIYCDDNRWLPQARFISNNTEIFMFSDLGKLVKILKNKKIISENSTLEKVNARSQIFTINPNWSLSPNTHSCFLEFYHDDYKILRNHLDLLQRKG